jgi:outer membrane protein TolC
MMKLSLIALLSLMPSVLLATELSLENYLQEVQTKNQALTASKYIEDAAKARSNEASLIFKPTIFAVAQTAQDKKPTTNVNAQGDRTDYTLFSAGIAEQFKSGLQAKLSYNLSHTHIYNAQQAFLPVSNFHDGVASIELSQSLWRNFWGKEAKAQQELIRSNSRVNLHSENFKVKMTLAQAEALYWSLSQMKKIVKVQKESLERAQKIKSWAQNRLKSGLGESSDYLQSDANFKAREFELKSSMQELKNLNRSFNSLRGIQSDELNEELEAVVSDKIKKLELPSKAPMRDDVLAALELQKITKANADIAMEKNKPTFELYGTYALNGRDPNTSEALSNSTKSNHDTKAIGIRFNAPVDFSTTSHVIHGYQKEKIAAMENFERKKFDVEKEWNDLVAKFEDAKEKLSLVEKIEEAQKIKASNERDRLSKGRTVTFQVLNFEQDYAQSELARIQSETAILNLYSQLKVFSGGAK